MLLHIMIEVVSEPLYAQYVWKSVQYIMFMDADMFDVLMEELKRGTDIVYKVLFLRLINMLEVALEKINSIHFREDLHNFGFSSDMLRKLKRSFKGKKLHVEINNAISSMVMCTF